jgi:AmmeMemoRadiSam system protein B/AmmeMemoRadiSam system protein A
LQEGRAWSYGLSYGEQPRLRLGDIPESDSEVLSMQTVRSPAVAGMFYPAEPSKLAAEVDQMLAEAAGTHHDAIAPKALIAPHAGYVYSGLVAASAYSRLARARKLIRRVILLGPVHRVPVRGLALPGVSAFATPLGSIDLDQEAIAAVRSLPFVVESPAAHELEHSLEVHLPFLQRLLDDFKLVPLAVGDATREQVAQVLDLLWGGDETLIVVSSDLSHYLPYDAAREIDHETARMILDLRSDIDHRHACGGTPVNGLMLAAHRRRMKVQLVDLRNSGDTAGGRDRVVGYGSFVLSPADRFNGNAGSTLIELAKASIGAHFGEQVAVADQAPWLRQQAATFVTLTRRDQLRGCIGSLEARRPLAEDVRENAQAAAFRDPRFKPLTAEEWVDTYVEVSLLSAMQPISVTSEAELFRVLRPGVDGLVLEYGHHRSTFLPQVWEQIPDPAQFLVSLRRKAGLPPDFWEADLKLSRYTVAKWREQDFARKS